MALRASQSPRGDCEERLVRVRQVVLPFLHFIYFYFIYHFYMSTYIDTYHILVYTIYMGTCCWLHLAIFRDYSDCKTHCDLG